jgi:D-alanyl-D-alanine carboxypeptidase
MVKKILFITLFLFSSSNAIAYQFASIAIDADSGKVYHAINADKPHSPASLTKMMTLYLLFEALEKKHCHLSSLLPVSKFASQQSPTKIHVKQGDKITARQAIEALATKSANDAAVVIAEYLGGSEENFALKMTKKARALGMKNTQFHNASGLPHPYQKTTARDIATLGLALMHHFPAYYSFFGTKYFKFRGRSYPNHNKLLFSYQGCTGLKTGYTRASGFNLAASAKRDGKNIIGVVLGEKSPGGRNQKMTKILNACFNGNASVLEDSKPRFMLASQKIDSSSQEQEAAPRFIKASHGPQKQYVLKPLDVLKADKPLVSLVKAVPKRGGDIPSQTITLQVGAYKTPHAARRASEKAVKSSKGVLLAKSVSIEPYKLGGKRLYRAHIKNVPEDKMTKICKEIEKQKLPCKQASA